jgi:hypothetical protein
MRGSILRHKSRLRSIVHQHFYPPFSTMVLLPLLPFTKGRAGAAQVRKKLADLLWQLRQTIPNLTKLVDRGHYSVRH